MERNANDDLNSSPGSVGSGTANGSEGSAADSSTGSVGASYGSGSTTGTTGGDYATTGRGSDSTGRLDALKGRAGELKATLADKLEAGADRLRQRGQGGAAYAAGTGSVVASDERLAGASDQLARGLQGTADFLRDGDLKATVEEQIKNHPGRTLLIAVGLGYLLGKALRK